MITHGRIHIYCRFVWLRCSLVDVVDVVIIRSAPTGDAPLIMEITEINGDYVIHSCCIYMYICHEMFGVVHTEYVSTRCVRAKHE